MFNPYEFESKVITPNESNIHYWSGRDIKRMIKYLLSFPEEEFCHMTTKTHIQDNESFSHSYFIKGRQGTTLTKYAIKEFYSKFIATDAPIYDNQYYRLGIRQDGSSIENRFIFAKRMMNREKRLHAERICRLRDIFPQLT